MFEISEANLAAADRYEVADYRRELVPLSSGVCAWVYAASHLDENPLDEQAHRARRSRPD